MKDTKNIFTGSEVDTMLFKLEVELMDDKIKTRDQLIKHIFDTITDYRLAIRKPLFSQNESHEENN